MAHLVRVPATVIIGAQWGDEGKGKIVDLLSRDSDVVCRYQGGPNAGHTIVVGQETYKIRALPSGIVRGKPCVIGNGCVVDLEVLISELDEFERREHSLDEVYVSGNAHLIMPWHLAIDQASERRDCRDVPVTVEGDDGDVVRERGGSRPDHARARPAAAARYRPGVVPRNWTNRCDRWA